MKARKILPVFLLLTVGLWSAAPSQAAIIINMVESGNDVVATLSGSINSLAGASLFQTGAGSQGFNFVRGSSASFQFTDGPFAPSSSVYDNYNISIFPASFGSGSAKVATSSTVNTAMTFGAGPPQIWIRQDYVLGTAVTGALTWAGSDFTTLGVDEGTYLWDWGGDSVTLNIGGSGPGPAPIPEPGTWAAAALLAGGAAFARWRRRKSS